MHIANETQGQSWMNEEHIQRFAKRLLEIEREACAQIALQWDKEHPSTNFGGCIARSIRTRGQHD
jgi:hypothetical protein